MATEDPNASDLQPPPELRAQWKKPFKEQVDFFRQKLNMPTQHYDDVRGSRHDKAFVVAGAQKAELLADFRAAVDRAIAEGQTLGAFQKDFDRIVAKHGWQHTGDRRWRAKVIYESNLLSAYGAGREKQLQDPELRKLRPYRTWRHSHTSTSPRRNHLGWDGTTLPHDDAWVRSHPAPCGWGCHCRWTAASRAAYREAQANGKATGPDEGTYQHVDRWGEVHVLPTGVDYGWSHTPGATWHPDLDKYPPQVARDVVQANLAEGTAERWHLNIVNRVTTVRQQPGIAREVDHAQQVQKTQAAVAQGEAVPVAVLPKTMQDALGTKTAVVKLTDADVVRQAMHGHTDAAAVLTKAQEVMDGAKLIVQDGKLLHVSAQDAAGKWATATLEASGKGEVSLRMLAGSSHREVVALSQQGQAILNKVPLTKALPSTHTAYINAGREITDAMPELDAAHPQDWHAELYRRMNLVGRVGNGSGNLITPTAPAQAATRLYPQEWVDASDALGPVHTRLSTTGRGYSWTASTPTASLAAKHFPEFTDLHDLPAGMGVLTHVAGDEATAVHEYAHRLQTALPQLDDLFQSLHRQRVTGDKLEQLIKLQPGASYKPEEVARQDHYVNPYQGKEYNAVAGQPVPGGALEVMTMAMEAVVGGASLRPEISPSGIPTGSLILADSLKYLRTMYQQDRQMLDLVVGALLHFMP